MSASAAFEESTGLFFDTNLKFEHNMEPYIAQAAADNDREILVTYNAGKSDKWLDMLTRTSIMMRISYVLDARGER